MEHKPLFADLIAAHKGQAEELKTGDVAAAVEWARVNAPSA
jgi:hypothetical protein